MRKHYLIITFCFATLSLFAQQPNEQKNAGARLLSSENNITMGGYAQIDYNQALDDEIRKNGILDVHRMVLLFGYKYSEKLRFVSEIEFEHVNELFVEQAFINYKYKNWLNFRGGLLLVPMGIVNEHHEPTVFNGVNRPLLDTKIIPSTWREIGAGFAGTFDNYSLKYQLYLVNGFLGYGSTATINGNDAFRKARQKGIKSIISAPNLTAKIEYFGLKGLSLGASTYLGKTQSSLYNNITRSNQAEVAKADSSALNLYMTAFEATYKHKGIQLRGQYVIANVGNTDQYNTLAKNSGTNTGIGKSILGFYLEAGYNVFSAFEKDLGELIPFVRLEKYNTHHKTDNVTLVNEAYNNTLLVTGLGYKLSRGVILKADMEFSKNKSIENYNKALNLGIGVWF